MSEISWRVRGRRAFWRPFCRTLGHNRWWGIGRVMDCDPLDGDVRTCLYCGRQEEWEAGQWRVVEGRS